MRATGRLTELTLAPLEVADTALLAEAIRGRPLLDGDRDLLQAATGGFPLHVVEAMRTAGGQDGALPAGDLEAVLRGRLDQASVAARELSGLAAAVGRDFPLDLLVEASDLDADSVVHAVDELWRLRIVHERGEGYDFTHDLLRTAAYERVSPPRRWLLHRRLAQGLELLHGEDTGTGVGAARTAVRPRRSPRAGRRVLPPRGRGGVRTLRPRRRDPAALRGAGHRAGPARRDATATARSSPSWRRWRRR